MEQKDYAIMKMFNNLDDGSVKKLKMEGFNLGQRIMSPIVED